MDETSIKKIKEQYNTDYIVIDKRKKILYSSKDIGNRIRAEVNELIHDEHLSLARGNFLSVNNKLTIQDKYYYVKLDCCSVIIYNIHNEEIVLNYILNKFN